MAEKRNTLFKKIDQQTVPVLACLLFFPAFLTLIPFFSLDSAWSHGFTHPLEGWDHIVTMIAVGIWAAQLRGHAIWLLPLAFVGVMSLGGIAGAAGILLPAVEGMILLSCAVFILLIIRRIRFSNRINLTIVAFFAFFHGFAHGQEISASASLISYSIGFMLATLLLHGAGILVAKLVLFCVTCFLAILLPSLAQAAKAQTISNGNSSFDPVISQVDFDGNSPWRQTANQNDLGSEHIAINDFNTTFLNVCSLIPDKPDPIRHKFKQRTPSSGSANISKIKRLDNPSGKLAPINQSTIAALAVMPPLALIWQATRLNIAAVFKHYFPDINYTPGQILLSNGTGLTSPPLVLNARIPARTARFYHTLLALSVEDIPLQTSFTHFPDNSFPLISTINPIGLTSAPRFNCIVGLTSKATSYFRSRHPHSLAFKGRGRADSEILQSCYTTLEKNHV
ncbi:MAG: HupE/UreJ family protein [Gammaproteobacteria bacterium]|nr:HupE/UreJ family protein [Gammaproteobacteria bacterium]